MNKKCLLTILTIVCAYFLFGKNASAASSEAALAYQRAAAALKQGRLFGASAEFGNFIDAEADGAIKPEMYLAA